MELHEVAEKIKILPQKEKMAILELIDIKSASDMKELVIELDKLNNKIDLKFEGMNSKYNVLIGMISFLGLVITVVSIIVGLKG